MIATLLQLDERAAGAKFWRFIVCVALVGVFQGLVLGSFIAVCLCAFQRRHARRAYQLFVPSVGFVS